MMKQHLQVIFKMHDALILVEPLFLGLGELTSLKVSPSAFATM